MAELACSYLDPPGWDQRPGRADLNLFTSGGMAPWGAVAFMDSDCFQMVAAPAPGPGAAAADQHSGSCR